MPPSEVFECNICCTQRRSMLRGKPQLLTCPGCGFQVCLPCQHNYAKSECMNPDCKINFTRSYMIKTMGLKFINEIVKPNAMAELLAAQKESLPHAQPLVEWQKRVKEIQSKHRFGIFDPMPPRPRLGQQQQQQAAGPTGAEEAPDATLARPSDRIACPLDACRGFIVGNNCPICHSTVCVKCQELAPDLASHVCKQSTLQSIRQIQGDSVPCPNCGVSIHRIDGCDHMHCTNCRCHFNYATGRILSNSSNGHYLNLARFSDNVRTLAQNRAQMSIDYDCADINQPTLERDRVDRASVTREIPPDIDRCLYQTSNTVRLVKAQRFNEQTLIEQYIFGLQDLQAKYLTNEITEEQWSQQIYKATNRRDLSLAVANVINLYLVTIEQLQIAFRNGVGLEQIREHIDGLIGLCNESFVSIAEEFSTRPLKIKARLDEEETPDLLT